MDVGPSFHFVPCFYALFWVLLSIYALQGFIRCEVSEYNESGKKKEKGWGAGGGGGEGDILRVL